MALEEITLPNGDVVRLGNIVPTKGLSPDWLEFGVGEQAPLIPRSEWPRLVAATGNDLTLDKLPPVHYQNGVGQCNADAATAALEYLRSTQGLPYVQLSAPDLYHRINWGRDGGSLLEDGMAELMKNGVGTAATSGTLWKRGEFKGEAPAAERAKYMVREAFLCPTFGHCFSAVLQGFALVSGIPWYDNYTPDADGWLPRPSGNSGGHAVFGYKGVIRNGVPGIVHQNSWGKWGWKGTGLCVFPESAYNGPVGGWWCVRSVTDEGGVLPASTN